MTDAECVELLQWALPRMGFRWRGFRKVRRQVKRRIDRRLRELELDSPRKYRDYLNAHPDEWGVLDRFCRISISRFYRDRRPFDALRTEVLPLLAQRIAASGGRVLRVWSAGCASGEEPYTVSLIWRLEEPTRPVAVQIVATDAEPHLLERARAAVYPRGSTRGLPDGWLDRAFDSDGDEVTLRPALRADVRFLRQDVRHGAPDGLFHLVLCRHMAFTYLDSEGQRAVAERIAGAMTPDGFLMVGSHEAISSEVTQLSPWNENLGFYRRRATLPVSQPPGG